MKYQKFNIAKKGKPYTDKKTGEEKTYWANVGTMTEFTNEETGKVSRILEIPAIGLEANVFPIEKKDKPQNF